MTEVYSSLLRIFKQALICCDALLALQIDERHSWLAKESSEKYTF